MDVKFLFERLFIVFVQYNLFCSVHFLQISSYFIEKLLGIVRDIVLHMKRINNSENDQQSSHGVSPPVINVHKGDTALEFIKHICAVLALDHNVQHDVLVNNISGTQLSWKHASNVFRNGKKFDRKMFLH